MRERRNLKEGNVIFKIISTQKKKYNAIKLIINNINYSQEYNKDI